MWPSKVLPKPCPVDLSEMLKGWWEEDLTSLYQLVMVNKTRIKRQLSAQIYGAHPEYKTDAALGYMIFDTISSPRQERDFPDNVSYEAGIVTLQYLHQVFQEGEQVLLNIVNDTKLDLLIRGIALVRMREGLGPRSIPPH